MDIFHTVSSHGNFSILNALIFNFPPDVEFIICTLPVISNINHIKPSFFSKQLGLNLSIKLRNSTKGLGSRKYNKLFTLNCSSLSYKYLKGNPSRTVSSHTYLILAGRWCFHLEESIYDMIKVGELQGTSVQGSLTHTNWPTSKPVSDNFFFSGIPIQQIMSPVINQLALTKPRSDS